MQTLGKVAEGTGLNQAVLIPKALKSFARVDDILAVIGIIVFTGVVVGLYSSYWQAKLAKAQYEKDFDKKNKK